MRAIKLGLIFTGVVAFFISGLLLLIGGIMLLDYYTHPGRLSQLGTVGRVATASAIGFGAWGTAASLAVLMRRDWGRKQMIAFGVVLSIISVYYIQIATVHLAGTHDPTLSAWTKKCILLVASAGAVGMWWVWIFRRVQFNVGIERSAAQKLPTSILLLASYLLFRGVLCLTFAHRGVLISDVFLQGRSAAFTRVFFGILYFGLGVGLLRLNQLAWRISVVLLGSVASIWGIFWLRPASVNAFHDFMLAHARGACVIDLRQDPTWLLTVDACLIIIPLFFLVARSAAFKRQGLVGD